MLISDNKDIRYIKSKQKANGNSFMKFPKES